MSVQNYRLPQELWLHVASFLPIKDVVQLSSICRKWRILFDDRQFWNQLVQRDFPDFIFHPEAEGRHLYRHNHLSTNWPRILVNAYGGPVPFSIIPNQDLEADEWIEGLQLNIDILKGTEKSQFRQRKYIAFRLASRDNPVATCICKLFSGWNDDKWSMLITSSSLEFFNNPFLRGGPFKLTSRKDSEQLHSVCSIFEGTHPTVKLSSR